MDRFRAKEYMYELKALTDFLVNKDHLDTSIHVLNAVQYRKRIVEREIKMLGGEIT